jgi:hypothetical protein
MFKPLICGLLLALGAFAQNPAVKNDAPEAKLLALEKMWNQAQLMRDASALENLVAKGFVNTEWDGEVTDRQKFLADIADPRFQPSAMSIKDVKVSFYDTTAVVTGTYHTKGSYQGKAYDHLGRFTDTWILENGKWVCVASHTSLVKK